MDHINISPIEIDKNFILKHFPRRPNDSNKGSFGKLTLLTGSDKYRGAAHLSLAMALRAGAGITRFIGSGELCSELRCVYPEAIYMPDISSESATDILSSSDSFVIGCGSDISESLADITVAAIRRAKGRAVIDADAINSIARYRDATFLSTKDKSVILTPHPLELSRISGVAVEKINAERISFAVEFARRYSITLLLKGYRTVITDGERVLINTTGNSALSKGGSGDVLAGLIGSLCAHVSDPLTAAAIGAYLHGLAGDRLSVEYSTLGVTPSDLPSCVARIMAEIESEL